MSSVQNQFETSENKTRKRHEITFSVKPSASFDGSETELSVSQVVHVSPSEKAIEEKEQRRLQYEQEQLASIPSQEAKAEPAPAAAVSADAADMGTEISTEAEAAPAYEPVAIVDVAPAAPLVSAEAPVEKAEIVEAVVEEKKETEEKKSKKSNVASEPKYVNAYGRVDYELQHSSYKGKGGLSLTSKKALSGWLFVLPFVLGILFIYGPIIIDSIIISFSDVKLSQGAMDCTWNNFANYEYMFTEDEYFAITLVDGIQDLILQIPAIVIFALFMAIILNQKMTGRAVFRAIFFLPVILSTGIIDSIDSRSAFMEAVNNSQGGVDDNTGAESGGILTAMDLQQLLGGIKIGTELVDYVVGLVNDIFNIVSRSGVQMLIFLSGLQSISPSIYESCEVEGASAWETFWKITLPMISPMILVNAVYTVIDAFTSADNRVMYYIFKDVYMRQGQAGYARSAAMSWVYIGVVLVFILVVALIMKTVVFYQKKD